MLASAKLRSTGFFDDSLNAFAFMIGLYSRYSSAAIGNKGPLSQLLDFEAALIPCAQSDFICDFMHSDEDIEKYHFLYHFPRTILFDEKFCQISLGSRESAKIENT